MPIELRILGGARTGYVESFDKSVIAVGRHPLSDLRFDPKIDLDVSTRHGEIRLVDGRYAVHDSQSTNGTYVNGQRVSPGGMRELHDNDVIGFGYQGPTVSVRILTNLVTPPSVKVTAGRVKTPPKATTPASPTAS
ncbi:MAG: FHA domain-containing protein, partial [bacterium]